MTSTVLEVLHASETRLIGVDAPRLSAEVIVAKILGCTRLQLFLDRARRVSDEEATLIHEYIERRSKGEPLAYILGEKEFFGLNFKVSPAVLIPRPETEHIIEAVQDYYSPEQSFVFGDLGTGSGILAVTLAKMFPYSRGIALDLSAEALTVARENATQHHVVDQIQFCLADFRSGSLRNEAFDLIVSNPPYVPQYEYDAASFEVVGFEPREALVSGDDGLNHIRAMLPGVFDCLKWGGRCLLEMGFQHGAVVNQIVTDFSTELREIETLKDLSGHDRITTFIKKNNRINATK